MEIKRSILILVIFTILLGFLYTGGITLFAQIFFHQTANGDFVEVDGKRVGSYQIGQNFTDLKHFWSRPSATNNTSSAGSNLAYGSEERKKQREEREAYLKTTSENDEVIPEDLLTSSASGLEAYISKEAAYYQIDRIMKYTQLERTQIEEIIQRNLEESYEYEIVNVLKLNLELNALIGKG